MNKLPIFVNYKNKTLEMIAIWVNEYKQIISSDIIWNMYIVNDLNEFSIAMKELWYLDISHEENYLQIINRFEKDILSDSNVNIKNLQEYITKNYTLKWVFDIVPMFLYYKNTYDFITGIEYNTNKQTIESVKTINWNIINDFSNILLENKDNDIYLDQLQYICAIYFYLFNLE
jgi:hypothetical protein